MKRFRVYGVAGFLWACLFVSSLATGRILYELIFPRLVWLARPFPALVLAAIASTAVVELWRRQKWPTAAALPLLLNLLWIFGDGVNLVQGRLWFATSLWLVVLLIAYRVDAFRRRRWPGVVFVVVALAPIYLLLIPHAVGKADTFEFQVVVPQLGIAHPTGYPLYLLLGKLFTTLIPLDSVAWRLNLATAVYALVAATLLYLLIYRLLRRPLPAIAGAIALGLTPTFWSQAIEAEVYTLHALIVALSLWLMGELGEWQVAGGKGQADHEPSWLNRRLTKKQIGYLLAVTIGLGLTNHLTTVFLLPPAALAIFLTVAWGGQSGRGESGHSDSRIRAVNSTRPAPTEPPISNPQSPISTPRFLLKLALAFLLPLSLYAYLPLRWQAVNGEPMGIGRFLDWVVAGRFQGALQWQAWLDDPTRYEVVGQLFLHNWGAANLVLAGIGLLLLLWRNWRVALVLLSAWLGYSFYALNYYVPDLAVFVIPAQMMLAVCWAIGVGSLLEIGDWRLIQARSNLQSPISGLLLIALALLVVPAAVRNWSRVRPADREALMEWGRGVLAQPLTPGAAILADSEKIAPLYYLQQAEGRRPDLEIMVLPDEAAYRQELAQRVGAGQTVYLARFLPGLQGEYHLRSAGPLTAVDTMAQTAVSPIATVVNQPFGPIRLVAYDVETPAAVDATAAAVTFYWQATEPVEQPLYVYTRWQGGGYVSDPIPITGQHPVGDRYPTNAWKGAEIVADYHLLPHPVSHETQTPAVQVALAPPFTPPAELGWQTVTTVELPPTPKRELQRPLRAQVGPLLLDGVEFPEQIRPQTPLPVTVSGFGESVGELRFELRPVIRIPYSVIRNPYSVFRNPYSVFRNPYSVFRNPYSVFRNPYSVFRNRYSVLGKPPISNPQSLISDRPFMHEMEIETPGGNGRYHLIVRHATGDTHCGWLRGSGASCVVGEVEVSGVALPEGAINFEDKIALLDVELGATELRPGGQLHLTLKWRGLAPLEQDYTVFIQVLDERDRIVGQVDAWPRQGTHPTSQWQPGETIADPYTVQLDSDLPPGNYRLQVGWYLLATLRRLPVVDENGAPIEDKVETSGLMVPQSN